MFKNTYSDSGLWLDNHLIRNVQWCHTYKCCNASATVSLERLSPYTLKNVDTPSQTVVSVQLRTAVFGLNSH